MRVQHIKHYATGLNIYIYIYIYIVIHRQTVSFLSEVFSVARSKPVQLYVRLCFRPLDHQADHVG